MNSNDRPARVRFAPSPTGSVHLGSGRTALYNYLLARKTGGQFILRIEDTDRKRYVEGGEQELVDCLHWLGLQWDEGPDIGGPYGPYRQSERQEIYQKYAQELVRSGHAYYCFCSPKRLDEVRQEQQKRKEPPHYDGTCRKLSLEEAEERVKNGESHVIRFKTPQEGTTTVHDELRGDITVENRLMDDYILVKSDGWALYHLAAMVDDHLMKITHVFRGSEWLPTFPLHCMLYRAFGWEEPKWVHLSLFLKPSGKGKMSKREAADLGKDGYSIYIKDLQHLGYLPEAVVNWIALMGWSYDDHTEHFLLPDLVDKFTIDHLNASPAAINFTKLDFFNGQHIRGLSIDELAKRIQPFFEQEGIKADDAILKKIAPIIQERITTLDESVSMAGFFFKDTVEVEPGQLVAKGLKAAQSAEVVERVAQAMEAVGTVAIEKTEPAMRVLVEEMGLSAGQVFGIMRIAITGQRVSPPLFESMEIIGFAKVMERLRNAAALLKTL